jgi:hypothetical protein
MQFVRLDKLIPEQAPLKGDHPGLDHKVSAKYMPLYVAEFEFRYNNRTNTDIFGAR